MFTGIVQGTSKVLDVTNHEFGRRYRVRLEPEWSAGLEIGASVSVNGVCQTVVAIDGDGGTDVTFDAVHETLRLTMLGALQADQWVNIERSLVFGQEVGGHVMSGHIDGVVEVVAADLEGSEPTIELSYPAQFLPYVLDKGYVGLHGCSLTVHRLNRAQRRFTVCLIPETLRVTNLSSVVEGDTLNLEIDRQTQTIVDTVERVLASRTSE